MTIRRQQGLGSGKRAVLGAALALAITACPTENETLPRGGAPVTTLESTVASSAPSATTPAMPTPSAMAGEQLPSTSFEDRLEKVGWKLIGTSGGPIAGIDMRASILRRGDAVLTLRVYDGNGAEELATMPELSEARLKMGEEELIAVSVPGQPAIRDEVMTFLFPGRATWLGKQKRPDFLR